MIEIIAQISACRELERSTLGETLKIDPILEGNEAEIANLLAVLLVIAVHCVHKDKFVSEIMELDDDVQGCLMDVISSRMEEQDIYEGSDEEEEQIDLVSNSDNDQQAQELLSQLQDAQHRNVELISEIEALKDANNELNEQMEENQNNFELRENSLKRELEREQLRCETLEETLSRQREDSASQISQLTSERQRIRSEMRDHEHILKSKDEEINRYQIANERFVERLQSFAGLKEQNKLLQEENNKLYEAKATAESKAKQMNAASAHADEYQDRIKYLLNELEDTKTLYKNRIEEMEVRFAEEREFWKREEEERAAQNADSQNDENIGSLESTLPKNVDDVMEDISFQEVFTPEMNKEMIRLKSENRVLLDNAERIKLTRGVIEAKHSNELKKFVSDLEASKKKNEKLAKELEAAKKSNKQLDSDKDAFIAQLQVALNDKSKKHQDMSQTVIKYKSYVEKLKKSTHVLQEEMSRKALSYRKKYEDLTAQTKRECQRLKTMNRNNENMLLSTVYMCGMQQILSKQSQPHGPSSSSTTTTQQTKSSTAPQPTKLSSSRRRRLSVEDPKRPEEWLKQLKSKTTSGSGVGSRIASRRAMRSGLSSAK
eukprot:TRINITY_DN2392_c0_g2_i1.p2 TRINITY_DN2392_c0_g2~~TRINITY_DN2392_c0_g2_i1.p2  ORF type:complete len:604 (+),score=207.21 TRINITY_DN2392_c0_g2_i1:3892-5703(+)